MLGILIRKGSIIPRFTHCHRSISRDCAKCSVGPLTVRNDARVAQADDPFAQFSCEAASRAARSSETPCEFMKITDRSPVTILERIPWILNPNRSPNRRQNRARNQRLPRKHPLGRRVLANEFRPAALTTRRGFKTRRMDTIVMIEAHNWQASKFPSASPC